MNKEGYSTIAGVLFFAIILGVSGFLYNNNLLLGLSIFAVVLAVFSIYFFRDPRRTAPNDPDAIISPADGKIIDISEVNEPFFFEKSVKRISIFLSILNVHVNYIPFGGRVEILKFGKGTYYKADSQMASSSNVYSFIGLETDRGKLAFKQITGMVARRIVCNLRLDDVVKTGDKFGIIKFGSRMEVFLPEGANETVKIGDKVRAGESIIAKFD